MSDFVSMYKLPFRSIDPRVQERILSSEPNSVGRTLLAAALCPEILSDRKRWEAPKSLAKVERLGEQCGRTPTQIRVTLLEWLTTPQKNLWRFPDRMRSLWKWDPALAGWIILRFCSELVPLTKDFLREPFEEAIATLLRAVELSSGERRSARSVDSAEKLGSDVREDFSPYEEFSESLLANISRSGPERSPWRIALDLREAIFETAFAMSFLDDPETGAIDGSGIGLAARSLAVALWQEWPDRSGDKFNLDLGSLGRRAEQIDYAERSPVFLRLLERAVFEYPYGYSRTSSSGAVRGGASSFARGSAMVAAGVAAGAVAWHFLPTR